MARADVAAADDPAPSPVHDRLLAAATELFAADGYESTTTAAIARAAGTSESQLIKHFGSKEGLLAAIFDGAWAHLEPLARAAVARLPAPLERMAAMAEIVTAGLEADRRIRTLMLLEGRRIRKRGHNVVMTAGYLRLVALFDQALQELQAAGRVRPEVHVQAVRSAWIGSLEGMLRDQLLADMAGFPAGYGGAELREVSRLVLSCFLTAAGRKALPSDPARR
jgi:AcrR family transcriptional regulator